MDAPESPKTPVSLESPKRRSSFRASVASEDKLVANVKKQNFFRNMKFVYFPVFTIVCDTLQFTFMPWNLDLPWPSEWKNTMKGIADAIFFNIIDIDLGLSFEVIQYALMVFVLAMLLIVYAPHQKLLLALGHNIVNGVWLVIVAFQTVLFLPAAKFALSAFHCTRYAKSFDWKDPDKSHCWTGRHVAVLIAASLTVIGLYTAVIHFILTLFSKLEITKRRFTRLSFALKGPGYAICLATMKLIFAGAIVIISEVSEKDPRARDMVTAGIMVAVLLCFLVFLGAVLPYKNQRTTCWVCGLLVTATFSNIMGLCCAILNNPDSYVLTALWVFGIPHVAIVAFFASHVFFYVAIDSKIAQASATKSLALGNDIQGALPGVLLRCMDALAKPNTIETLDLGGAFLGTSTIAQISMAVAANMSSPLKRINFSRNSIVGLAHGIDVIIAKSETVEEINLDHNHPAPGIPFLATALAKNCFLRKLSMMNCGLNYRAGIALGEAFKRNNTIIEVNVSQNYLKEEGAIGMAEGLAENKSITSLDVSWNEMMIEGLQAILDAFDRPVNLNMICNKVPQATLAEFKKRAAPEGEPNPDEPSLDDLFKALEVSSIFELVGKVLKLDAKVAIGALCDDFYIRLVSDRRLLPFFSNVSMGRMRNLQKDCLIEALGGPKVYKGMDLGSAHAHFKIDDDVYDCVIAHLFASVLHFIPAPPKAVVTALVDLTEALRSVVCNSPLEDGLTQSITDGIHGDPREAVTTVMDKDKAVPYFGGSVWSTGLFKRRKSDDIHPGLAPPKMRKGFCCCPFVSSVSDTVPQSKTSVEADAKTPDIALKDVSNKDGHPYAKQEGLAEVIVDKSCSEERVGEIDMEEIATI